MTKLTFDTFENNELEILLRDLSLNESMNIKDLYKDNLDNPKSSFKNIKKKQHLSSKDKIISDNIANKKKELEQRDLERLDNYKSTYNNQQQLNEDTYTHDICNFKTTFGKNRMKYKLLEIAYKQRLKRTIVNLYLQLLGVVPYNKHEEHILEKVSKYLSDTDYKTFQFEHLSNELAPLDFYNDYEKKLDDWQINVINYIKQNKSVLVSAPTSCGKTWLALYPGIIGKRVLFIVPTDALVYQVGALFQKFSSTPCIITADGTYGNLKSNVFIGTPKDIEDKLPALGLDFEYVVYDEIHNLDNTIFGHYYERLIKIFKGSKYLALSATLKCPEKLNDWLSTIHSEKGQLVVYTTRFLNLQRHLWNNSELKNIHPISCLNIEDINKDYLIKNLPLTPYDCVVLYRSLSNYFSEEMENLSVSSIFKQDNKRLSLDDARQYEDILKNKLLELKNKNPELIKKLLDDYKIEYNVNHSNTRGQMLYSLFKQIKDKKMTPCIVFQQNTEYCRDIFVDMVHTLETMEKDNYPFHYINLEYMNTLWEVSQKEKEDLVENMKLSSSGKKELDRMVQRDEMLKRIDEKLLADFELKMQKNYEEQVKHIQSNINIDDNLKRIQLKNLEKEYKDIQNAPSLKPIDIFAKHHMFCMNSHNPMSADTIRDIKRKISYKLKFNVDYNNVFMQGLKRGIGIYTCDMPPIYNLIVQKLAQNGELGFVIADVTLALGINMPFRSTCILGYKDSTHFDIHNYLQMIGRSGRRGLDREGHIIYANVEWKNLMKGELNDIKGHYIPIKNYAVVSELNSLIPYSISEQINNNLLNNSIKYVANNMPLWYKDEYKNRLLWKTRIYNDNTRIFISKLVELETIYRREITFDTRLSLIKILIDIFYDEDTEFINYMNILLKTNQFPENSYHQFRKFKELIILIKDIYNILEDTNNYTFLSEYLKDTFVHMKLLLFRNNGLN